MSDSKHEAELRRANRALRMLSDSNQSVIRAQTERELLDEVCRIAVAVGGYALAWVGLVETEAADLLQIAARRGRDLALPYGEREALPWREELWGRTCAACAIRTGLAKIVPDLARDPDYAPWREATARLGYRAAAGLPMIADGRTLGALAIYAADADAFDPQELAILEELAGDVAYGLNALRIRAQRDRATAEVRRQSRMLDAFFEQSTSAFVLLDCDYRYVRVNEAFARFHRLRPEDFTGKIAWFLHADQPELCAGCRALLERVVATRQPLTFVAEAYVAPARLQRERTYWDATLQPILDEAGAVAFLVCSASESTDLGR